MKINNFSNLELENFIQTKKVVFFNYKKCYLLKKTNNSFKFIELISGRIGPEGLKHCKKGRFHAMQIDSSYCQQFNILNDINTLQRV